MTAPDPVPAPPPAAPPWRDWHHMTGAEIDACDRDKTVILVTSSPIEVHGPHLPTITDVCEAEGITEAVARKVKAAHPEIQFLRLPPIYVAADVLPHVGSLMFRQSTIQRVFEDLGQSLARQGFRHVWVGGFHGGPRHFVPVEMALDRVNRRFDTRMISVFALMMKELTGGGTDLAEVLSVVDGVEADQLRGDAHGGMVETSLMLHLLGEHVRPVYREVDRNTVHIAREKAGKPSVAFTGKPTLPELIRALIAKLHYYEEHTWSGTPRLASADHGAAFLDILAGHGATALGRVWTGELALADAHSPVWKLRWVFRSELLTRAVQRAIGYQARVF